MLTDVQASVIGISTEILHIFQSTTNLEFPLSLTDKKKSLKNK